MVAKKTIKKTLVKKKVVAKKKVTKVENKFIVTPHTSIGQLIARKPEAVEDLFEAGMHCIGCAMSQMETLEMGCLAHGMTKKELDNLIKKINERK